jgi:S-formylglutathione hydrolase
MKRLERHACFGGWQEVWEHEAASTGTPMRVGVFLPPQSGPRPVLYWLSGLTCTEQNALTKSGIQQHAARHGLIVVTPDTSPRGEGVADDPTYDLGQGAGFYVDATEPPWDRHFRMASYVSRELPLWIQANFPASDRRGISGHSMGGHGALVLALRNPGLYHSVSAFAPIVEPSQVPWGQRAFAAYLGPDPAAWVGWDACALLRAGARAPMLTVDVGAEDPYLKEQLQPWRLQEICAAVGQPLTVRMREGYDHSYYFVSSFLGEHVDHHAEVLLAAPGSPSRL